MSDKTKPEPSEEDWQAQVVDRANGLGWTCFYVPDWIWRLIFATMKRRRRAKVWSQKGYPDLCCRHDELGVFHAELKAARGTVTPEQAEWLDALKADGRRVFLWKPEHEDAVRDVLEGSPWWQDDRRGGWTVGKKGSGIRRTASGGSRRAVDRS